MMPQPSAVSTIYAPLPKTRKRGPTTQPLSLGQTMTDNEIMTAKPKKKINGKKIHPIHQDHKTQRLRHPTPSQTQRSSNQPFNELQMTHEDWSIEDYHQIV